MVSLSPTKQFPSFSTISNVRKYGQLILHFTWWLYCLSSLWWFTRLRPKSAIFNRHSELIRRFAGFKSLCMMLFLWRWATPFSSISMQLFIAGGDNGFSESLISSARSDTMNSKTRTNPIPSERWKWDVTGIDLIPSLV